MSQFIIDMSKKNLTIIVFDDKFKTLLQLTEIQFKDRLHLLSADMIKLGGDDIEAVQEDMRQYLIKSAHLLTLEPRRKFKKMISLPLGLPFVPTTWIIPRGSKSWNRLNTCSWRQAGMGPSVCVLTIYTTSECFTTTLQTVPF